MLSISAKHNEIAIRYAWMTREQRHRRGSKKLIARLRMREIERLFAFRYGDRLPNDDAGMEDLVLAANQIAQMDGNAEDHILRWALEWAPWLYDRKDIAPILFARRIAQNPRRYKADTLATLLNLTVSSRAALGITTIGAVDCNKQQRLELRRERKRAYAEARRRANGAKPRALYEAESLSRTKPWEMMEMSRSTWYAKGKPMPQQADAGQVQTQQTKYPLMLDTELSETIVVPIGKTKKPEEWMAETPRLPAPVPPTWIIPAKPNGYARAA